ncbi:unnamed protein product [Penicillium salamii]|uniref:Uncharacterized protein n=1 Tax=Penicillium salamii TaxID=1612424 RepID=A0A9W4NUU9_9EURO|nr:unnamed protein product [Penicillium salamii]
MMSMSKLLLFLHYVQLDITGGLHCTCISSPNRGIGRSYGLLLAHSLDVDNMYSGFYGTVQSPISLGEGI